MRSLWALGVLLLGSAVHAANPWVVYEGADGPGKGKHIVLVSGDEEYRSEEALPQLGKILAKHHGFRCTVLFAIDPKTGEIDPNVKDNIPGLVALKTADLMIIATRMRDLPDDQMKHIVDYVESGRPIIGLRTATHAFQLNKNSAYRKYTFDFGNEWPGGFGKQILGETWVSHHGAHNRQSCRGIVVEAEKNHPILRGIKSGDVWGPTDVYGVHLPLPGDSKPLLLGAVLSGMKSTDEPVDGKQNDPMMPIAWTKSYLTGTGRTGRVFTTTMGASVDLLNDGLRRLLVQAAYWALNLEAAIPASGVRVELVGEYKPRHFSFNGYQKGVRPADHEMKD